MNLLRARVLMKIPIRTSQCVAQYSSARLNRKEFSNAQAQTSIKNFITTKIEEDIVANRNGGRVLTRFPPEPNGYLHLGHAKSINFNFGVAKLYHGATNMRFDDTNPANEDIEYINSILEDVKWLVTGNVKSPTTPWEGEVRYASDYFPQLYEAAEFLISQGLAYVDDLTPDQMREYRGSRNEPGKDSPFRSRAVSENLRLFRDMKAGVFAEGHCVLRARIDMQSCNMNMRDPPLYRIKTSAHPMTGTQWRIYPMYDFAHAMSDALEGITHSLCTLEFENHRPLYDWVIDNVMPSGILPFQAQGWRPQQIEFSRLNVQYTVLSKRKLIQLVAERHVTGWDDPRMPTVCGMRRRGFPHTAIQLFCERVGVTKTDSNVDMGVLEECVREVLDRSAPRLFAVANPLKVVLTNWAEGQVENFTVDNHPGRPELGQRVVPFSESLFIETTDFFDTGEDGSIQPPQGFKRLLPKGQVRLKNAYVVTCDEVVRDASGNAVELRCRYDANSGAGVTPAGSAKVKGIIPWVSQRHAVSATLRLYDRLFRSAAPGQDGEDDFLADLNRDSLQICRTAVIEPSIATSGLVNSTFQFERNGYFMVDRDSSEGTLVLNRVVTLKDTWTTHGAVAKDTGCRTASSAEIVRDKKGQDSVEDIRRLEMRVGLVVSAELHPDADSLFVEKVDCGDSTGPRTIISGLARHMSVDSLVGRKVLVLCNLKPSKMRGIVSEGMLLAASKASSDSTETVELVTPPEDACVGELVHVDGYEPPSPDAQLKSKSAQEVWKRVAQGLITNDAKEATFGTSSGVLRTKAGPCVVASLANAPIH